MYGALTYRGDLSHLAVPQEVTRSDGGATRTVPHLLGTDALGRPYEVLDVEVLLEACNCETPENLGALASACPRHRSAAVVSSRVHLGPASVESTRGNRARVLHAVEADRAAIDQRARCAAFWRPDLYSAPALGLATDAA